MKSELKTSIMLTGTDLKPRGPKKIRAMPRKKDCRSLKANEAREAQEEKQPNTLGMLYMIELYSQNSEPSSCMLDTGCGTHLCNNVQDLRNSMRLRLGEIDLRMGNGEKLAALCLGICSLVLPNGLVLDLEDCVYVPSLVKNIISICSLCNKGFSCLISYNECSIYFNEIKY